MADNSPTSNNLVIGDGVTFKGSISAPGKAIINGVVSGELIADDLLIGQKGKSLASCERVRWMCTANSMKISVAARTC